MALIVETGTGLADAESYATLAQADDYHAARGITLWATMSEAEREQALRRATDYMVQAYRTRWAGVRKTDTQALDWPRYDVPRRDGPGALLYGPSFYPSDAVPVEVRNACAELAYRGAAGPLMADKTRSNYVTREKVDVIEVEYAAWAPTSESYRAVEALLSPMLTTSGASVRLVRA
jgi:hypothetical protein